MNYYDKPKDTTSMRTHNSCNIIILLSQLFTVKVDVMLSRLYFRYEFLWTGFLIFESGQEYLTNYIIYFDFWKMKK